MKQGKVWLAGAGPGDAGLLTVKTKELLEKADTIVYDALIGTEILCQLPPEKELIYVGKRAGRHPVEQEEINRILLEKAREGKDVLRLKGGDPFVFGRGGEELQSLVTERVPFEIIPGVTSASAVPAYAGIPLTHRDYASSFHVITGHSGRNGSLRIDYPALVKLDGTLVFLMGLSALEEICGGLLRAGMSAGTPAAVLERGTSAKQRSILSDVGHLAERAREAHAMSPAVIVVGEVCSLAGRFCWAEKRVLGGRQFVVTRPGKQGADLSRRLRGLGAQVLEVPAIETVPVRSDGLFVRTMERFARREGEAWLVFTSPTGVRFFFARLMELGMDLRHVFCKKAKVRLAVIGSATGDALRGYGLTADLMPSIYDSANLGKLLARTASAGSEVVIARAAEGSKELIPPLEKAGLAVTDLALYETGGLCHEWLKESLAAAFTAGEVDGVIFTSASTVRGFAGEFLKRTPQRAASEILPGASREIRPGVPPEAVAAFCIGKQTAREAEEYGMKALVSKKASMDGLVELICETYGAPRPFGHPASDASHAAGLSESGEEQVYRI